MIKQEKYILVKTHSLPSSLIPRGVNLGGDWVALHLDTDQENVGSEIVLNYVAKLTFAMVSQKLLP